MLSVHFGEDKTKSILSSKANGLKEINISFTSHFIKEHDKVEHLGCQLDSKLSGEAMASKVLKNINSKLSLLYQQRRYLTLAFRWLLCNAVIYPYFVYGCSSWFPSLKKNLKTKHQKHQNKCIRFCLNLPPWFRIDSLHFRKWN